MAATSTASKAFVGQAFLSVGNGASPETYTDYCEVSAISGLGQKNALVDVTTFCSNGTMEYIGGLSDGNEVTITANYALNEAIQDLLIEDVENKNDRDFIVRMGSDSPSGQTYHMKLAMLSWELTPSVSKQNEIKFTGKITGPMTRVTNGSSLAV